MYFAPHNGPGIWLAYADSLTGPWTVYGELFNNNSWGMNVGHISSPDPIWISEESKVFVYFHGENQDTKYAVSTDGINFSYGDRIVSGDYGRVHKYTIPRYNNKYILLTSTVNGHGTRDVHLSYSNDARNWTEQSTPLFSETALAGQAAVVCSPLFVHYNGKYYVWVHGDNTTDLDNLKTNIFSVEVGANLDTIYYVGKVYDRQQVYTGNIRVGDPYVYTEPGKSTIYMFVSVGERLYQDIYLAIAYMDSTAPAPVMLNDAEALYNNDIKISWQAAIDSESGVSGYEIYRDTMSGAAKLLTVVGAVTVYADTGMKKENTVYYYRLKAVNSSGLTSLAFSNEVSANTHTDTIKPSVIAIHPIADKVFISFSEKVEQASAENSGNYTINNGGIPVTAATLQAEQKTVVLSFSTLAMETTYSIRFTGVRDQAAIPNTMNTLDTTFSCSYSLYYWPLEESSDTSASDATGHGNTATLHGAPIWVSGNKYGNALSFDGADDYLSTSILQMNPDVFTLSLWFKTASTTGGKLIGFGEAQTGISHHYDRHLYMDNAGKIYFGCYNGSVRTINTAIAFNDNAWHYAAATLSGAGMMLYVDGVLAATNANVTSGENYSGYWRMGFDDLTGWTNAPSSNYFIGQLDDIRVYDQAFSASEIASLYGSGTENEPVVIAQENLTIAISPNPFNPSASISYSLPQKAAVSLVLYNLQGKIVKELASGMVSAGRHTVKVDAGGLASGVYLCELKSGATAKRLKLVLMR